MNDSGSSRSIQLAYILALIASAGWCLLALQGDEKHPSFFLMLILPMVTTVQLIKSAHWVGEEVNVHHRSLVWNVLVALIMVFVFVMWSFLIPAGRPIQPSVLIAATLSGVLLLVSVVLAWRHGYRQAEDGTRILRDDNPER